MTDVEDAESLTPERSEVRNTMLAAFGPVLKGSELVRALGFDSMEALRQAKRQKRVGVPVFLAPRAQRPVRLHLRRGRLAAQPSRPSERRRAMT